MKKAIITTTAIILVCALAVGIYAGDYYRAEETAVKCITNPIENITVTEKDKNLVFSPQTAEVGIIFYPGGKVDYKSYSPLLTELAKSNILSVVIKMPLNLAVLDINAAEGIQEQYPDIKKWYLMGHSLGGSMAASYLSKNENDFSGLILLASYSTADLKNCDISVLSIYGSEDNVLNKESYNEYKINLPEKYEEVIIEGGCHAYFGAYGVQNGDGTPTITQEEQVKFTANKISIFIN